VRDYSALRSYVHDELEDDYDDPRELEDDYDDDELQDDRELAELEDAWNELDDDDDDDDDDD
jgi:hypothetical protein